MIPLPFTPSPRPPLAHQVTAFERFKDKPYFALHWEQRVRKTRPVLDIFRYRYARGEVDALVIIAWPNGVQRVWLDEIKEDFPTQWIEATRAIAWASGRTTQGAAREAALALRDYDGPVVAAFNCEAIITKLGWKYLEWLLKKRRVMLVADEYDWAANWNKRTQKLLALGRRPNVIVKIGLTGTPCDEGPCDLLYPTNFLKFGVLGYTSMAAFKSRYIEYEEEELSPGVWVRRKGYNRKTDTEYDIVKGVQNLEELHVNLDKFASRLTRSQVSDAPAKTYQKRYFQLTALQRKVYDRLRAEYVAELSRGPVSVAHVLTRRTRLQMIARNFYPPERVGHPCTACASTGYTEEGVECLICDGLGATVEITELERIDPARNPAAEALTGELRATRGPVVVWCKFRNDVEDARAAAVAAGRNLPGLYYGAVPERERHAAYEGFRSGTLDMLIATGDSGLSRGHDLTRATTMIVYSNGTSARTRRQLEDRAESLTRMISTDIVDIVGEDTVDESNLDLLRGKFSISQRILNDPPGSWL